MAFEIINRDDYRITMDSFGSICPANWEEIADYLNDKIDEIISGMVEEDEYGLECCNTDYLRAKIDALWTACLSGELADAPVASDEPWEDR